MIQPNEVRMLNWVLMNGRPHQWVSADFTCNPQDFEPIPLTEEVLRAAGFEPDYDGNLRKSLPARMELWFYRGNSAEMDLRQDGKYISFRCAHVKYLHELQNLYFALTGSELEVSLTGIGNSPIRDNK